VTYPVGTRILRREVLHGHIWLEIPVTVVHDAAGILAVLLEPGTPLRFPPHPFGPHPWSVQASWAGTTVLQLNREGDAYGVWKFFDEAGDFSHWYVNFEEPLRRGRDESGDWVATHDHGLDIVIRDGAWQWKDYDEPAAMVESGRLSSEDFDDIRREGSRVAALLDAGTTWWDRWEDWQLPGQPPRRGRRPSGG
jgi:hypothetical protein